MKFYAYSNEKGRGIVTSWEECKQKISGIKSKYKKFPSREIAQSWLDNDFNIVLQRGIYFDAGTGSGETEIRVTDEKGAPLLQNTNSAGNISAKGKTNNYGELKGMFLALEIAIAKKLKKVFGDSKLVIDYWSKGFIKRDLPKETVDLAMKTKILREKFEDMGRELLNIYQET